MNHEAIATDEYDIGVSSEIYFGIHQFGNEFFLNRISFKGNKHTLSERMEKEKGHFRVDCQKPANRNHAKIRSHKKSKKKFKSKKSFTGILYST